MPISFQGVARFSTQPSAIVMSQPHKATLIIPTRIIPG